ncbi:uncharacterized protein LOC111064092 isoform X3 [Nilaparvata lugens]|uniref:uncharacterized protein LOC111064092 isoform X3 n=1 Tax=Nilaparvata lugens TaxID=108931 RepID=UPI00193E8FC3|nr:uncharacterized protein LOC111064092 isoform X3 [Nilaparvata lugens]
MPASDCWYRRWRNRWSNVADNQAPINPTEIKQPRCEDELSNIKYSSTMKRILKTIKDDIKTEVTTKKPKLVSGHNYETHIQVSSCCDSNEINNDCSGSKVIEEPDKEEVINRITNNQSTVQESPLITSFAEYSDTRAQSNSLELKNSLQLEISPNNYTTSVLNEIDSSLGQINDVYCFKTQEIASIFKTDESVEGVGGTNCGTSEGVEEMSDKAYIDGNERKVGDSKTENSFSCSLNGPINAFSSENIPLQTVLSDDITNQITALSNYESSCVNGNVENAIQFESCAVIPEYSGFPNFAVNILEGTSHSCDKSKKLAIELEDTQNFVEMINESVFPIASNFEESINRSNELVTELKSVGLDLCEKDQDSLELMNSTFIRHSENSVSSDNFDSCLMSAEFQIPGLSLGSDDIFENYRNSLFMESNYMFCENCDDFHMNEVNDCEHIDNNYEENESFKNSETDQQSKSEEKERIDTNNKEEEVCSKDGEDFNKRLNLPERNVQRKQGEGKMKKGERYLPKFKAKVVAYAKAHTIRATVLKFNVSKCSVIEWIRAKSRENKKQNFEPYKELIAVNVEEDFIKWLKSIRESQLPLNQSKIIDKLEDLLRPEENTEKHTEKWLEHYLERLKNVKETLEFDPKVKNERISGKYVKYPLPFKREVTLYAEKFSQKAASRDFCVSRRRVYEWMQTVKGRQGEEKESRGLEKEKRDSSSYVVDATIDRNILEWYKSQSVPPTENQVREMGVKLYADEGHDVSCSHGWWRRWRQRHDVTKAAKCLLALDSHILEWLLGQLDSHVNVSHAQLIQYVSKIGSTNAFSKVSNGWALRFCKRYPTLLQRTPQFDTNLPPAMEMKVLSFRKRIQELISKFDLKENDIGTIDEIPIRFTDKGVRVKEQLIRKSGFENCQASLLVSCLASGRLLPSIVIVKGSLPEDVTLSNEDVKVFVRENSCLDSEILHYWINNIWSVLQTKKTSILVSNNFQPYKDATASKELTAISCKHEFFPPGCLSKLQPIRVALSTAFQDGVYDFWKKRVKTTWGDEISFMDLPSHHDIFDWTTQIHRKLAATCQEEIESSFRKTLLAENGDKCLQNKIDQSAKDQID